LQKTQNLIILAISINTIKLCQYQQNEELLHKESAERRILLLKAKLYLNARNARQKSGRIELAQNAENTKKRQKQKNLQNNNS